MQIELISSDSKGFRDPLPLNFAPVQDKVLADDFAAPGLPELGLQWIDDGSDGVVTVCGEAGQTIVVSFTSGNRSLVKMSRGVGIAQLVKLSRAEMDVLGDGDVIVTARATDGAGNLGVPGDELVFWLDTLPPDVK